jgi:hypothetical protein
MGCLIANVSEPVRRFFFTIMSRWDSIAPAGPPADLL